MPERPISAVIERKSIPFVDAERDERNRAVKPDHVDRCYVCGKPATAGLLVRTVLGSEALHRDAPRPSVQEDSGLHPIGSECARKLGAAYTVKCSITGVTEP